MKQREKEIWKSIKDFPDYEVSNLGRIRSYKVLWKSPYIIGDYPTEDYHRVSLSKEGKVSYFHISFLVLQAFVGPCPTDYEANHKDGIKANDWVDNLEWVTSTENRKHAYRLSLMVSPTAKLKSEEVLKIRKLADQGTTQKLIAKMYQISQQNVSMIIHRRIWKHVNV